VVLEEIGFVPKGTDTVPAAAVSGAAQDIAASRSPEQERFVFFGRPLAGFAQVG
jgi:hypothetical protein